jgi:bifunctional NMN adenylyltransferase/nudix hydrolase
MYDTTVLCGRFQPFHKGHFYVVSEALKQSEQLILVVGGAGSPRSPRNPFSYEERKEIILDFIEYELGENVLDRIWVVGVNDHIYSDTNWMAEVQAKVSLALTSPQNKIALIGHSKDHTSYYLKMFPQWGSIEVPNYKDYSATQIRNELFRNTNFTRKNAFSSTYFRMLNLTASETIKLFKKIGLMKFMLSIGSFYNTKKCGIKVHIL